VQCLVRYDVTCIRNAAKVFLYGHRRRARIPDNLTTSQQSSREALIVSRVFAVATIITCLRSMGTLTVLVTQLVRAQSMNMYKKETRTVMVKECVVLLWIKHF